MKQPPVPFNPADALACAEASQAAYAAQPDFSSPLMHARVQPSAGAALLAFRGTKNPADLRTDAEGWRVCVAAGEVHYGFWHAWESVRQQIYTWPAWSNGSPVYLAGHSLGGAVAQLCAWAMVREGRTAGPVRVYTLGSPRVGNRTWAEHYNLLLGDATWHVINQVDAVPRLPGPFAGFHRAGQTAHLSATGRIALEPSLLRVAAMDLAAAAYDLRHFRLGCLADHAVEDYVGRLRLALHKAPLGLCNLQVTDSRRGT